MYRLLTLALLGSALTPAAYGQQQPIRTTNIDNMQVGTFLGNEVLPDGTYTNNINCGSGPNYTCTGSAGFNAVRVYYVKTDEGIWHFETKTEADDATLRRLDQTPMHFKKEKSNLLDALKPGDKVAFRATKDHRIRAGNSVHIHIPRADDPKKEEEFEGWLYSATPLPAPTKPTDNVKALCGTGKLSADDEKNYCGKN